MNIASCSSNMFSEKLTVCIFAFNEEKRILRCIRNFSEYAQIMVVDNFSTDSTKEIVESVGIRCISVKNPNFIETDEVMTPVLNAIDTDYILIASVSEYVPLTLLRKYAEVANAGDYDVVRAFRVSITAGQPVPISGVGHEKNAGELRFFCKGSVSYVGNQVHGRGSILASDDRVLNVVTDRNFHFYQFRDYDCSHTENVLCRYDDVLAKQRYDGGQRFSWGRALYYSFKVFYASYFRFGSFRYGMLGFLHSYYRWHMEFTTWLRIWEWQHSYTRSDVMLRNDFIRKNLELELDFHSDKHDCADASGVAVFD